jgi:hypothetical protein
VESGFEVIEMKGLTFKKGHGYPLNVMEDTNKYRKSGKKLIKRIKLDL